MNLQRVQLTVGDHAIHAHVARNDEDRALGLQHCRDLGDSEGMLFMCDAPQHLSFWMKDTPLPLSAAFVADDGTILQLEDMDPETLDAHRACRPVRFVLEMARGWFRDRGIVEGDRLRGPVFLA
jgi:uncharacterized membrane protein (UPF0127 family)